MLNRLRLALLALLLAAFGAVHAQQPLPVPALTARVIDQTATLTPQQAAALEAKLAAFEAEAGSQLVVLMLPTTQPEDIASYAQRVGETWKLGRREVGDGLLIVVAKNDRRIWIATAKSLEGAIPDLAAKRVIASAIQPAFRANDYAGGLSAAVDQLATLIHGEQLPLPQRDDRWRGELGGSDGGGLDLTTLAMFFFVAVPVLGAVLTGMLGRKLGSLATAGAAGGVGFWLSASIALAVGVGLVALLLVGLFGVGAAGRSMTSGRRGGSALPPIIWGGGGGGWGGGFGGGGGGFGSGGGGDFGGGGAGGDW